MRTTIIELQYAVRIDRLADGDGGGYLAVVPELPGCMSDGVTPEEALGPCAASHCGVDRNQQGVEA